MVRFRPLKPWDDPRCGQSERVRIDNSIIALEMLSLGGSYVHSGPQIKMACEAISF